MEASALAPALAALTRAQAVAARVSPKEQALIEALAARYSNDPNAERVPLDAAYAAAMGKVAARYPDDLDIAVLYAESLMDLSPWDWRAEPYADRLGRLMPGAGHVVHMPSHIYYRVGRYLDSLAPNKAAVAADEAYVAQVSPTGIYPQAYYPHNVHFVLVSAQTAGDGKTAIEAATKLERTVSEEAAKTIPWVQPIKAAPLFAHARFSDPATVLALPDPGDTLPYVKAMWHYARGVAQAARGDLTAAQREADAIAEIARTADFTGLVSGGVPATDVLEIARRVVLARTAHARGDLPGGVRELEAAVAVQDSLPYTEPPFWYYPVRQSLGALLLLSGRADEAAARLDQAWAGDRSLLRLPRL